LTPSNDRGWLTLLQLHDSAFPVGAYAHSNGLETYAQAGMTPDDLAAWLATQLRYGFGRLDLAATALAWQAEVARDLERLGRELDAWKVVPALRATSLALGRRTHGLASRLWPEAGALLPANLEPAHHAVVLGAWSRALALPLRPTLLATAQGSVTAALAAGTRCLPLGPERAQAILVALQPAIATAVARVEADPAASLWSATPGADLRAQQQSTLTTRLFQS
jgi:urease accessory protein